MSKIKVQVKPVAGNEKYSLEVEKENTLLQVKEQLSSQCNIPAVEQRLIFKGQILKDDRTVESYGTAALAVLPESCN